MTKQTDRFLCDRVVGAKEGAGYLTPVPPNAVVYGSGESASIISRASHSFLSVSPDSK